MHTVTLMVNESVFDKFQWLISQFSKKDIVIVDEIDPTKLPINHFDYISKEEMSEINQCVEDYKNGKRDDYVEYVV